MANGRELLGESSPADGGVTVLESGRRFGLADWKELWEYRELWVVFMLRDIKVRYKQTILGAIWAIIQPVMAMVVFSIIFGKLAKIPSDGYPYPIFVFTALLPWQLFSATLSKSSSAVVGHSHLLKKVYFPRLLLPFSAVGSPLVDFFISIIILVLMLIYYGITPSFGFLLLPLWVFLILMTAVGVGTFFGALSATYRDFAHVVPFVLQIWMYATPVVYPASLVPEQWEWMVHLNPVSGLIETFRASFLGAPFPTVPLFISATVGFLLFVAGILYFRREERRMADII